MCGYLSEKKKGDIQTIERNICNIIVQATRVFPVLYFYTMVVAMQKSEVCCYSPGMCTSL